MRKFKLSLSENTELSYHYQYRKLKVLPIFLAFFISKLKNLSSEEY